MKIALVAMFNFHSYAIRTFHALLAEHGVDVESFYLGETTYAGEIINDASLQGFSVELSERNPDVIALSVYSPMFQTFKRLSAIIRKTMPQVKIAVGGEHPTASPESCLPYADFVIVGEGEKAILKLCRGELKEGITGPNGIVENLDDIPMPHYGENTFTYCINKKSISGNQSYLASRGCPYNCSYCHENVRKKIYGKCYLKPRKRSVDRVIDDLNTFPSHHVFFSDSIFTSDKAWLEGFCDKFCSIDKLFSCYGHTRNFSDDVLKMLKEAGIKGYRVGVQSGSLELRKNLFNRKDLLTEILEVAWMLHGNGVHGSYDFIVNNPYDDQNTLKQTRGFIDRLPPKSQINCFELRWFPGTKLTRQALKEGVINQADVEGEKDRLGGWSYSYIRG